MAHSGGSTSRRLLAFTARSLTLSRIVVLGPFLWLMIRVAEEGRGIVAIALALLYLFVAVSDFLDGRLARLAGAANAFWARADVSADILFNFSSLTIASRLGLIGPWVPVGVGLLGGRFLWRTLRSADDPTGRLEEDRAGKLAGVFYYALVGWIVVELATGGLLGRLALVRGGDAAFLYTIYALWRGGRAR